MPCAACNFLEVLFDGVVLTQKGTVTWLNGAAQTLTGLKEPGISLRELSVDMLSILSKGQGRCRIWRHIKDPVNQMERRVQFLADARWVETGDDGQGTGTLIFRDVTALHHLEMMDQESSKDPSGLLNERGFRDLAGHYLQAADPHKQAVLIAIRMSGLPDRETSGIVRAEVLRDIAIRLHKSVRGNDYAAYLGDGLFAVLLTDVAGQNFILGAATRIIGATAAPMLLTGTITHFHAHSGIAISGLDGRKVDELLAAAIATSSSMTTPGLRFANAEIQVKMEQQAIRSRAIRDQISGNKITISALRYEGAKGVATLFMPSYPDMQPDDVWAEAKGARLAESLLRQVVEFAVSNMAELAVIPCPNELLPLFQKQVEHVSIMAKIDSHRFATTTRMTMDKIRMASLFGERSLTAMHVDGVSVLLAPSLEQCDPLHQAELSLAANFFDVYFRAGAQR